MQREMSEVVQIDTSDESAHGVKVVAVKETNKNPLNGVSYANRPVLCVVCGIYLPKKPSVSSFFYR